MKKSTLLTVLLATIITLFLMTSLAFSQDALFIDQNGNLGIGTTSPGSYKLAVKGKIRAEEVVVETGWSDFVFDEGYELPTLDKVESYINENKHLPDIPSAEEVKEKGLPMAEMLAKQMQKIEELTLYVIELQKKNESLEKELKETKEDLISRLASLE